MISFNIDDAPTDRLSSTVEPALRPVDVVSAELTLTELGGRTSTTSTTLGGGGGGAGFFFGEPTRLNVTISSMISLLGSLLCKLDVGSIVSYRFRVELDGVDSFA